MQNQHSTPGKQLPIELNCFDELITEGYHYIDKTQHIIKMLQTSRHLLLCRPNHFGKTLLISTLTALFKGKKELFKGLWVENRWDWAKTNPVVNLSFKPVATEPYNFEAALKQQLHANANQFGILLSLGPLEHLVHELVNQLSQKSGRVVILIDDYDAPLSGYPDTTVQDEVNLHVLKAFYASLKAVSSQLRLVFSTGQSPIARKTLFPDWKHLAELTLNPKFGKILGFTIQEIQNTFGPRLTELATQYESLEELTQNLSDWYGGFSWNVHDKVHHPGALLYFLNSAQPMQYWSCIDPPTNIVKYLNQHGVYHLDHIEANESAFSCFDPNKSIRPFTLLFQTGYLSIQAYRKDGTYTLGYPNKAVRQYLLSHLLAETTGDDTDQYEAKTMRLHNALAKNKPQEFARGLTAFFKPIPKRQFKNNPDGYYYTITYLALNLLSTYVHALASTAYGQPDCVVYLPNATYIIELTLGQSATEAMQLAKTNNHSKHYSIIGQPTTILAMNFNPAKKAIDGALTEVA